MSSPITHSITQRLHSITPDRLAGMRRGIEKESLRIRPDGRLSTQPHPAALGSALTHPHITTDFCESQVELVTGVHASGQGAIDELTRVHQVVYRAIGNEMLWVGSMPCGLPNDDDIPIGQYGSSNVGQTKSVYRMGLANRYGRRMQTISGIHYNWSMPGINSDGYFSVIRNFRRHSFLLLVLFGASPAVCSSFVEGRQHTLQTIKGYTLGLPHATSLRMGRLGYQSDAQSSLAVSYNDLENYGASLEAALTQPHSAYESIGIRAEDGSYRQLSAALLQIENEFYGTIRPKRVIQPGERPLHALRQRGVEYVEVRCMDLDPFEPVGINASTTRFLDLFLLHCLLIDSPPDSPTEIAELARNQDRAAMRGREPGLRLERVGKEVLLMDWAVALLEEMAPIAAALDRLDDGSHHAEALQLARQRLHGDALLPSAQVLQTMHEQHDDSYVRFTLAQSAVTRNALLELPLSDQAAARLAAMAQASLARQHEIETADKLPFEAYRQQYLAPERLSVQPPQPGSASLS